MHTHTAVKSHRMGQSGAGSARLAWHGDHYPIETIRQASRLGAAWCCIAADMRPCKTSAGEQSRKQATSAQGGERGVTTYPRCVLVSPITD